MSRQLTGQIVAVVGGTSGIGAAIAVAAAAGGADVIIAGRNVAAGEDIAAAIVADGGVAHAVECDVTSDDSCSRFAEAVEARHGRLDTIFANHGVSGDPGRLTKWSDADIESCLAVNLVGCVRLARAAEALLTADGGGRMIVTGSGSGHENIPGLGMYGISKAAVSHLVRQLSTEWRSRSIAVNELVPGPVRTPMTGFDEQSAPVSETAASQFEDFASKSGEWLKDPADVAPLALFLAGLPTHGPTGQVYSLAGRITR